MMSIILKGIDLPRVNEIRMVAINSNGKVFFNTVKDGTPDKTKISHAIQIPRGYGRLIIDVWDGSAKRGSFEMFMDDEPTILESEENDEYNFERD